MPHNLRNHTCRSVTGTHKTYTEKFVCFAPILTLLCLCLVHPFRVTCRVSGSARWAQAHPWAVWVPPTILWWIWIMILDLQSHLHTPQQRQHVPEYELLLSPVVKELTVLIRGTQDCVVLYSKGKDWVWLRHWSGLKSTAKNCYLIIFLTLIQLCFKWRQYHSLILD